MKRILFAAGLIAASPIPALAADCAALTARLLPLSTEMQRQGAEMTAASQTWLNLSRSAKRALLREADDALVTGEEAMSVGQELVDGGCVTADRMPYFDLLRAAVVVLKPGVAKFHQLAAAEGIVE
jgi:hypothetical protein